MVKERIRAIPEIGTAIFQWYNRTDALPLRMRFTQSVGTEAWDKVLLAIAAAGPFTSCNDAAVRSRIDDWDSLRREKWRNDMRRRRKIAIKDPLEPDTWMIAHAPAERIRRASTLWNATKSPTASSRMKAWSKDTCDMVADIWLARILLEAGRARAGETHICRKLIELGLGRGKSFDALRQRVIKDLDKLKHIEACGVWMSDFDPLGENYDPDLEIAMSKIACLAS